MRRAVVSLTALPLLPTACNQPGATTPATPTTPSVEAPASPATHPSPPPSATPPSPGASYHLRLERSTTCDCTTLELPNPGTGWAVCGAAIVEPALTIGGILGPGLQAPAINKNTKSHPSICHLTPSEGKRCG